MLHLSCLFFYNLFYCYFYYIIFISKGKSWSFPWMFCFVFAVFWCCDKKHQSTSLPSLLKPLRFDMYVYLFYHLLSLLVICRSVAGNVVSVSLSILLTVFLYFLLIFYSPLSLVAMSVSLLRFCQSFQIFFSQMSHHFIKFRATCIQQLICSLGSSWQQMTCIKIGDFCL